MPKTKLPKYPNNIPYLSAMPPYWKIDFMEVNFIANFLEDLSNMKDSTYWKYFRMTITFKNTHTDELGKFVANESWFDSGWVINQ